MTKTNTTSVVRPRSVLPDPYQDVLQVDVGFGLPRLRDDLDMVLHLCEGKDQWAGIS